MNKKTVEVEIYQIRATVMTIYNFVLSYLKII